MTMRNRLSPAYDMSAGPLSHRDDVDSEPGLRLWWLAVAMTVPLLVVAARLTHLQGYRSEAFAVDDVNETSTIEEIPARHGRIVSAEGQVLAFDDERHRVLVQFRWLEEPPNERWLRDEAVSRMSRADRRDKLKVEQAKSEVLARRAALWQSLAELAEVHPDKLQALRSRIQNRVERILQSVEDRRRLAANAPVPEVTAPAPAKAGDHAANRLAQAWEIVKHELTTTPTRDQWDPLRIPEQSDFHVLLDDVDWQVVAAIETNPARFPGIRTDVISRRVYPVGDLAPHVIGYRTPIRHEQLAARSEQFPEGDPLDYRTGDLIGRTGVERAYETVLRGVRGQRKVIRDRHGAVIRTELLRAARPGRDIVLNLNTALQTRVNSLLREVLEQGDSGEVTPRGGCVVALDVRTGAVLAAANAPAFDLNHWLSGSEEQRLALLDDVRKPLFSRATQSTLPPGSVFKTVSAIAAIESGRIDPDRGIECRGYLDQPNKHRCYLFTHFGHGHGATDLTRALAMSCNVYFFQAARTIGPQTLCDWADRCGFGQRTGIDLPGERSGHLPRPPESAAPTLANKTRDTTVAVQPISRAEETGADHELDEPASPWDDESSTSGSASSSAKRTPWYSGDTLGLAIGQSRLTATPIQIGRLMAAVANGGWLVTPHVAREISPPPEVASDTNKIPQARPIEPVRQRIDGLHESSLSMIREGLEAVVSSPQGTGFKTVRLPEIAIAGKTGTAEIGGGRPDHAWFAGYAPADNPQIAFVVVLEQAGSGGKAAGPVAKRLVQSMQELGLLK